MLNIFSKIKNILFRCYNTDNVIDLENLSQISNAHDKKDVYIIDYDEISDITLDE